MIRRLVALLMVGLLAACSTVSIDRADVPAVVTGAFRSAGLKVSEVEVADAPVEGRWPVTAVASGTALHLEVDAAAGRVVRIDLGEAEGLSRAQLEELASYRLNPADDRAQRRRQVLVVVLVTALGALGLLVARRHRLREEADEVDADQQA